MNLSEKEGEGQCMYKGMRCESMCLIQDYGLFDLEHGVPLGSDKRFILERTQEPDHKH